ncbi:MAG: DUF885 domain-containing protein [Frankiaceae bacterium]
MTSPQGRNPTQPISDRPLDRLVAEFLAAEFDADPQGATALGVPGHDERLPELSDGAISAREALDEKRLRAFEALPDGELTDKERIDRDLVVSQLRGRLIMRDWAGHRRDPAAYVAAGLNGVFTLFLHRLRPDAELAAAAARRLAEVPRVLAEGRANLEPELASPLLVRRALAQTQAGVMYCRQEVPRLAAHPDGRPDLGAAAVAAADAYAEFGDYLADFEQRATGQYAIGEQRYTALLQRKEGLGYGAGELRQRGRAALAELTTQLRGRTMALAGHDDWRGYLAELDEDAPQTPEDMLAGYRTWTERARGFAYERGLVSEPPGDRCDVLPAEEFQRAVLAVAFYCAPPPFAAKRHPGHFFVPYPPTGATPEQVRERLATNSRSTLATVSVHEAYPGHHWHLAWLAARSDRPVRKVLWSSYFVEGWALYVEEVMREQGFFAADPKSELRQVDMRQFRAARIVVDTSLHLGEMTVDEAVEFMSTRASLTPDLARSEVARYCAWPTQAASYLTGALEIARMRDEWLADGHGTLRDFHDTIAGLGGLPIGLAEQALRSSR